MAFHDIDEDLVGEIDGRVYNNTKGFYEKYFQGRSWSPTVGAIVHNANLANVCEIDYPNPPTRSAVLDWFPEFQSAFIPGGRPTYHTFHNLSSNGPDSYRKPDLFLTLAGATAGLGDDGKYIWEDVQVIGKVKQTANFKKYQKELLKFCELAREVFSCQPTRLFLHGFIIRGYIVELWVFDRSGPYSCEKFNIRNRPDRFIEVMVGYTMMTGEELGLNTFIKEDENGKYITVKEDDATESVRLYLGEVPISYRRAVVCRGTTCYRAKKQNAWRWEFIVKFSWRSDERPAEGQFLKLAAKRGVWGVPRLFSHQDLHSIADLRRGLQFGKPRTFIDSAENKDEAKNHNAEESFKNRILNCLVTYSPGREISAAGSTVELLEAFRDAIKAHMSLYRDGKILHRNISDTNIIITRPSREEDPKGMLIDLDQAAELGGKPIKAMYRPRHLQFMAIETLEGDRDYIFRHDLESFLYVFLRVIVDFSETINDSTGKTSVTRQWDRGTRSQMASTKFSLMDRERFRTLTNEFAMDYSRLKTLAEELRALLFPIRHNSCCIRTFSQYEHEKLYGDMIHAFDKAIDLENSWPTF
ncbi:hypothetical protein GP486_008229 [Trichoglossum hirsutum]|uniref:Fungal-type protein kinase domain-containing protein n=1 Tax=Trichoglossum hirsutum TaxID=265104 RepID=A0A9P8L6D5_9PEZI|nr:hypothetical protein GP486_008229 [Trichoglossum hirsutum]